MIKISDIRSDNTKMLKDIEPNGFFYYDDILCRRLTYATEVIKLHTEWSDSILVVEMATGDIKLISRETWVEPITDRQVFLEISD